MNNTKERPIVLTAQEVNAVLADDKTQHRVPLSSQPYINSQGYWEWEDNDVRVSVHSKSDKPFFDAMQRRAVGSKVAPFKVGDRIWVQEKHRPISWAFEDGEVKIEYKDGYSASYNYLTEEEMETNPNDDYPLEVAQELIDRGVPCVPGADRFDFSNPQDLPYWRNASAMPRWASRLLLEATNIRIERVQNTSHADAVAEGVHHFDIGARLRDQPLSAAQTVFSRHWDNKHQDDDVVWEYNPWVWVIEFKVVEPSAVSYKHEAAGRNYQQELIALRQKVQNLASENIKLRAAIGNAREYLDEVSNAN